MLVSRELSCSEDESCGNKDVVVNVYGHTRRNNNRNENIQDKVRVASMDDNMKETRIRWFKHVKKRCRNT